MTEQRVDPGSPLLFELEKPNDQVETACGRMDLQHLARLALGPICKFC